ncbi:hypothetical protein C7271_08575 [filamentous cyanobacterium CCP5]|nr:hypothetical protein C7271_08575 [filamentous cyanobacterium CCP5]
MLASNQGFITILTGLYSYQDCVHFLASVRKFHSEPIVIVIDRVPWYLTWILKRFADVHFVPAPRCDNPVLASRFAKVSLYQLSPFEKTLYLDCDTCLLDSVGEIFEDLDQWDLLVTPDVRPKLADAINLLRVKQDLEAYDVLSILSQIGLVCSPATVQYNGGLIAFRRTRANQTLFEKFTQNLNLVLAHQDVLFLKDQGAFAAAIEFAQPRIKTLPPTYNFMSKWKEVYGDIAEPIKILHCTYPIRPQFAKNVTRSWFTRGFDRLARYLLPNQVNNPWRRVKAQL